MTCPRCNEEREKGGVFCRHCGSDLRDPCPHCSDHPGDAFCRRCGRRLDRPKPGIMGMAKTVALYAGLLCGLILLLEFVTMWLKLGDVISSASELTFGGFYWLDPMPQTMFTVSGNWIVLVYVVEAAIVTLCLWKIVKEVLKTRKDGGDLTGTAGLRLPMIYSVSFVLNVIVMVVFNEHVSTPDIDGSINMIISLLHASVYEELYCRLLCLGLPILVVSLILARGKTEEPWYRYLLGGFGYRKWMLIFLILSAFLFGLAHYDGWGAWKVIPSFVMGLFIGYLFVRYGLYAAISMHFLTDFALSATWLIAGNLGMTITALSLLSMVVLGLCGFVILGKELIDATKERRIL